MGSAFTSVGGKRRGYGGHEAILQSFHATFLQHGMVSAVPDCFLHDMHLLGLFDIGVWTQIVVGNPPNVCMDDALNATPFGVVMAGKESANTAPSLNEQEVKLAYSMGEWTAQVRRSASPMAYITALLMASWL